ncbi:hypothetical protein [Paracidovorax avenae]|uniref:hypothetical protein n=1 Tax=Paracidovorax avenae TaxID=80867 RepID=UPI001CEF9C6A|nr:hypothetical protein [Paracidovorax avenae]
MPRALPNLPRMLAAIALAVHALHFTVASAPIYVVVSAQSPLQSVNQNELVAIYTGRTRAFPDGSAATPLDQKRDGPARAEFYQLLTGMDIARINSYWARLHFTGQVRPPQTAEDDTAMLQRLRNDPSAIGYITRPPQDNSVRVVMHLP